MENIICSNVLNYSHVGSCHNWHRCCVVKHTFTQAIPWKPPPRSVGGTTNEPSAYLFAGGVLSDVSP